MKKLVLIREVVIVQHTFGYVYKKKTKYVCRDSGGAKSNHGNPTTDGQNRGVTKSNIEILDVGCEQTTMYDNEALGRVNHSSDGDIIDRLEISGADCRRAGGMKSESFDDRNTVEDY